MIFDTSMMYFNSFAFIFCFIVVKLSFTTALQCFQCSDHNAEYGESCLKGEDHGIDVSKWQKCNGENGTKIDCETACGHSTFKGCKGNDTIIG